MTSTATFTIEMHPGQSLIDGSARFDFTKTWNGALEGTSHGAMLTAGDPAPGSAGSVALQYLGTIAAAVPQLPLVLPPGSGTGEPAGGTGTLTLESVADAGVHQVGVALH